MGKICYHKTTGVVSAWVRQGALPPYNAGTHAEMESDIPPPSDMAWSGSNWISNPPKTDAEKDADLQVFLDSAGGRVVKAIATVLMQKNVLTLAEIRQAYRAL